MKISLLTLLCSLFFVACGENPDKSAPSLKDFPEEVSIFDTLEIEFNENLKDFDSTSYSASPDLNCWSESKYIKCVGVDIYPDVPKANKGTIGTPIFLADTKYTLSLESIEDSDGNDVEGKIELEFNTLLHLDTDFEEDGGTTNDQLIDADSIGDNKKWVDGSEVTDEFFFSGVLEDKNQSGLAIDHQDVYSLYLNAKDSITLSLYNYQEDLELSLVGPIEYGTTQVPLEYYDTMDYLVKDQKNQKFLGVKIDGTRHITGINTNENTPLGILKYWIVVTYKTSPETEENRPTSYTLGVQVEKD